MSLACVQTSPFLYFPREAKEMETSARRLPCHRRLKFRRPQPNESCEEKYEKNIIICSDKYKKRLDAEDHATKNKTT